LFKLQADHYVFAGPTPPSFKGYNGDQAELLVRYLFQLTPQEQQRLIQMSGSNLNPASVKPSTTQNRGNPKSGSGENHAYLSFPRRRESTNRKSKIETRNSKTAPSVVPAEAGIHGLMEPRPSAGSGQAFRGGDDRVGAVREPHLRAQSGVGAVREPPLH
jgi:hypothetical protein